MRLGQLIETLEALPASASVVYDFGPPVGSFGSWRGVYAELTLYPGDDIPLRWNGKAIERPTVADVLRAARMADGGTFSGYKGGEYTMDRHTPVWADGYGDYYCRGILGIEMRDGSVVLKTADLSDYR